MKTIHTQAQRKTVYPFKKNGHVTREHNVQEMSSVGLGGHGNVQSGCAKQICKPETMLELKMPSFH